MAEATNASQGAFVFGSDLPAGPGPDRPAGRTNRDLGADGQRSRLDRLDAPSGHAGRSRRAAGATPVTEPGPGTGLRWLTAVEATAYLGFPTRKALYAAVERGQVPARKLGRRLRFRLEELDALLGRAR